MDINALLNAFDLINKLDGLRGDVLALAMRKGGGVYIEFLPPAGSCGADIEDTLRRFGVGMWGRAIPRSNKDDCNMADVWCGCHVRRSQATWARYLMARKGCYIGNGAQPKTAGAGGLPVAWADRQRGETKAQQVQQMQPQRRSVFDL